MSVLARSAVARPAKFANDPPLSSTPSPLGSKPTIVFSHSITWCSMVVAAGADRHEVTFWLIAEASRSAIAPAKLPEDCT